jgi:hypothetical protein
MYRIQVGKNKSAYKDRYVVATEGAAFWWFNGLNTHSGYKKRIVNPDGKVIARVLT